MNPKTVKYEPFFGDNVMKIIGCDFKKNKNYMTYWKCWKTTIKVKY